MNRRHFIYSGTAAISGLALSSCVSKIPYTHVTAQPVSNSLNTSKGNALFGYVNKETRVSSLRVLNWDNLSYQDYILPLKKNPHYVAKNLVNPKELFIMEFVGAFMKLNLETNEYLLLGPKETQNLFLGHFTQSIDGEKLLCVEGIPGQNINSLVVRSAKTLEQIEVVASYYQMHHIIRIPNSTLVAYQGQLTPESTAGVYIYDYEKRDHINFIETDYNFPSHLTMMSPTEIVAPTYDVAARVPGMFQTTSKDAKPHANHFISYQVGASPLYHMSIDGSKFSFWDESHKDLQKGGMSAIYLQKSKKLISCFVGSDTVALWKDYKLEKTINTNTPFSLLASHDESEFMVYSTHQGNIKVYSSETFEELRTISFDNSRIGFLGSYT